MYGVQVVFHEKNKEITHFTNKYAPKYWFYVMLCSFRWRFQILRLEIFWSSLSSLMVQMSAFLHRNKTLLMHRFWDLKFQKKKLLKARKYIWVTFSDLRTMQNCTELCANEKGYKTYCFRPSLQCTIVPLCK